MKPTVKTFGILATGGYYDSNIQLEGSLYPGATLYEVDEDQKVFEYLDTQYLEDELRRVVLRNKETNELWAVDAYYAGASWGENAFVYEKESSIYPVVEEEVTVIQYKKVK